MGELNMNEGREITVLDSDTQVAYKNGAIFIARRAVGAPKFKLMATVFSGSLQDRIPGEAHIFEHCPFEQTEAFPINRFENTPKNLGAEWALLRVTIEHI